jgi:fumarate reductase subunit D
MMANAFLLPALIVITGFLVPLGILPAENLRSWLVHPLGRAALFVLISLTFFHAAHRLRYALVDLGMKPLEPILPFACYGVMGIGGTILAALVALWVI